MNPNTYKLNQMHIEELLRTMEQEREALQQSAEESLIATYLNAHLLAPLGRKLIQSGNRLLEWSDSANQQDRVAYHSS